MNTDKDYYKLIKSLPREKCSAGFTEKIIQASGILADNPRSTMTGTHSKLWSCYYGLACVITMILIVTTINMGIHNSGSASHKKMAANTIAMARQLSDSVLTTYIMNERSIGE